MLNNIHLWIGEYVWQRATRRARPQPPPPRGGGGGPNFFLIVVHFEPCWGGAPLEKEIERTSRFLSAYETLIRKHKDSSGVPPKYSFFYPIDEYTRECVERVADFCRDGYGEVEVHLHHKDDTE